MPRKNRNPEGWICGVLSLACMTAPAQAEECTSLSVSVAPVLKAYRLNTRGCTRIHQNRIRVGRDAERLILHSISNCRDFPALPNSCEISAAELWSADGDADCEIAVDWTVTEEGGAVCHAGDR